MIPTLEQVMGDNLSAIHFWNTSIDMLIPTITTTVKFVARRADVTLSKNIRSLPIVINTNQLIITTHGNHLKSLSQQKKVRNFTRKQ